MSAPEPIDEFDRLLANEDKLEKYVSLGLALEELLEKLRAKGFEAEKETLSRLLELSPSRAQLLELAAERLLDSQKRQDEQAFLRDPHNLVQPFRSVLKENRDEVERLVAEAPSIEPRSHPGAVSKEVGPTTRLSDGCGQLRQGSVRVGEGNWSRPKGEGP